MKSKKKKVVVALSAKAKFRTLAREVCELLLMKIILLDNLRINYEALMKIFCDNKLAVSIAQRPIKDRIKHIEIYQHFIKKKLNNGLTKGYLQNDFENLLASQKGQISIHWLKGECWVTYEILYIVTNPIQFFLKFLSIHQITYVTCNFALIQACNYLAIINNYQAIITRCLYVVSISFLSVTNIHFCHIPFQVIMHLFSSSDFGIV